MGFNASTLKLCSENRTKEEGLQLFRSALAFTFNFNNYNLYRCTYPECFRRFFVRYFDSMADSDRFISVNQQFAFYGFCILFSGNQANKADVGNHHDQ